ncbi:MAG TPA: SMC-Scp complex subunit ScpB [Thermomicrobiales bacterium]|jgi:segregation and condensation protein B
MTDSDGPAPHPLPTEAAPIPAPVELPDGLSLPALCEALLFVAAAPTSAEALAKGVGVSVEAIIAALDELDRVLESSGQGLRLQRHGTQYALTTVPSAARLIARFLGLSRTERLSPAALETLAIVAYRGPVTRGEIESIRGVDSSGVVQTLLARELIEAIGRRTSVGQPVEYAVTVGFLRHFGLASLAELPPLGEVNGRSVEETWDERSLGARAKEAVTPPEG